MNKYTSLKLSKWLQDNGFEGESEWYYRSDGVYKISDRLVSEKKYDWYLSAYDILNDLCVKYAKEIFGEAFTFCNVCKTKTKTTYTDCNIVCNNCMARECKKVGFSIDNFFYIKDNDRGKVGLSQDLKFNKGYKDVSRTILFLLQQNRKDEAEEYIMENSILNPKNKL